MRPRSRPSPTLLRPQLPDLVALVVFFTFAYISFRRKSVPLKYATLVASVAYMGFYKSSLISITTSSA